MSARRSGGGRGGRTSAGPVLMPAELVPAALREAFGDPVPTNELSMWGSLNPGNREKALDRLRAVREWEAGTETASAEEVAKRIGTSRSRFYRMLSDWRGSPSLGALGVNAVVTSGREVRADLRAANEVAQRLVVGLVGSAEKEKVSVLARRLGDAVVAEVGKSPKETLLRAMVDRELRRRQVAAAAGNEVVFDMTAVGIPGVGGVPHVMFACVDVATAAILGFGFGDPLASRSGYRAAAIDALARLGGIDLPWAPALARAQLTIGGGEGGWPGFFAEASAAAGAQVQEKGAGGRVGSDLRRLLGESIGSVRLVPRQTFAERPLAISVADAEFSRDDAKARLEVEVGAHNARQALLVGRGEGEASVPTGLTRLLELLAI